MTGGDERLIGSDDEVGDCIGERKLSGSGCGGEVAAVRSEWSVIILCK